MIGMEKDILILMSRVRCITENQVGKFFGNKKSNKKVYRKPFKKTLKKMCNEHTLRKYPCNINYPGYKDNSYVYYINGSTTYKGKDLAKVVIGSEIIIKLDNNNYKIRRIYRNVVVDAKRYDLFLEYVDKYDEIKQILIEIDVDRQFNISKYENLKYKISKSTIPFFEVPKVIIITSQNTDTLMNNRNDIDICFVDMHLNELLRYL